MIFEMFFFRIVKWMIDDIATNEEEKGCIRAIQAFSEYISGTYNLQWKYNSSELVFEAVIEHYRAPWIYCSQVPVMFHSFIIFFSKKCLVKDSAGRGRKRTAWVRALHDLVLAEFDGFRKDGVQFNSKSFGVSGLISLRLVVTLITIISRVILYRQ